MAGYASPHSTTASSALLPPERKGAGGENRTPSLSPSENYAMATLASVAVAVAVAVAGTPPATALSENLSSRRWRGCCGVVGVAARWGASPLCFFPNRKKRRALICAVNQDAEKSFQKTVEVDRLIDMLRDSNPKEFDKLIVENVLAFDESFWIRLAARTDTCKSEDDKKDYEELAASVMSVVDQLVHKTNERIESATDVLKAILKPVVDKDEEISWPPREVNSLIQMERELEQREQEGQLDEGFLSEVNAQLRQAKGDRDKPGLEAMLQKVLQIYASKILSKRSYARKGNEVLKAESFLEAVIKAPEESWNELLIDGLTIGRGDISPEDFYAVIKKRIERTLIRTEGGSYQQRILVEYLKGIESRTEDIVQAIQGKQT